MNPELEIIPEDPEVTPADENAAKDDVTEPLAETPDEGDEEESVTPDEADEGDDEPERKTRSEKRKEKIKAEIDQLTREKYEARRAAEEAQRQMAEMQQYLQQHQPMPQVTDMPKLEQFDYDTTRYEQAIQQWHVNNLQQEQMRQQQTLEQQQQYAAAMREQQLLQAKVAEGTKKYPDFAEKVNNPSLPPLREVNRAAFDTVIQSDAATDIAYYLASNPVEVYAFADMTPAQAIKRVAQLEAKLEANPPAVKRMPPKPPSTVRGTSNAVDDPSKLSTEEWIERRNRQLRKKR